MDYSTKISSAMLLLLAVMSIAPISRAVTVGGSIDNDTTWTAAETIIVGTDVTVTAAAHLTIQAGTVIRFIPGTGLIIEGQLTADGPSGNHILFTALADTAGGSPSAGGWQGIAFQDYSTGVLRGCDLRYATNGVLISGASPQINDCVITNFLSAGISINSGSSIFPLAPTVTDCFIGQDDLGLRGTGKGIYVYGRVNLTVSGSTISNCLFGLEFYSSGSSVPDFQITNSNIRGHAARGIYTHPG